jgi:sodium/pantothenate symporter
MGALVYKDTRAMHKAIILGAVFVSIWTLVLPYLGTLSKAIFPELKAPDQAVPLLSLEVLPPWLAGITLAGVAGAIQSTVGAMILVIVSSIVRDTYQEFINPKASPQLMKKVNIGTTIVVSVAIFIFALDPPQSLQMLVVFAIGGLSSALLCPLLFGLYWMRCNEHGALAGMIGGMGMYVLLTRKILPASIQMGMAPIVVCMAVSLVLTVGVSLVTPKTPRHIIETWFGMPKKAGTA